MKKVYDWDLTVGIYVETCKKKFTMVCSIHTNIHEIMLRTAKLLDLDCFDTKIDFYYRQNSALRATSTLQQCSFRDGDVLTARIIQTKSPPKLEQVDTRPHKNKTIEKKTECYGLTFVCTCVEPRCVNYGKDVSIPFGTGEFPFFQVIGQIKCKVCPYRDQMKNPPMLVKEVELNHCLWRVEGTHLFRGFPTHNASDYKRCKESRNFYDQLRRYKWQNDLVLTVKEL